MTGEKTEAPSARITVSCTICHPHWWLSVRRDARLCGELCRVREPLRVLPLLPGLAGGPFGWAENRLEAGDGQSLDVQD